MYFRITTVTRRCVKPRIAIREYEKIGWKRWEWRAGGEIEPTTVLGFIASIIVKGRILWRLIKSMANTKKTMMFAQSDKDHGYHEDYDDDEHKDDDDDDCPEIDKLQR